MRSICFMNSATYAAPAVLKVLTAEDGEKGCEMAAAEQPDIILPLAELGWNDFNTSASMIDVRRREVITLLGGAAAWPVAALAQQPAVPVIGVIHVGLRCPANPAGCRISHGLVETGYDGRRNMAIEFRWADGQYGRVGELAGPPP